ncbi:MAG: zinc-ribbon domain-containing protein [Methanobrevibacter sp.]|nr:zinc-ribbon domain-containing protein [Methanobrevibacter sp.]MBE6497509.1 zinc-ribbon domain-containing protein [Methanobrevibacter sp.]
MVCPICGSWIEDGELYCPECGYEVLCDGEDDF